MFVPFRKPAPNGQGYDVGLARKQWAKGFDICVSGGVSTHLLGKWRNVAVPAQEHSFSRNKNLFPLVTPKAKCRTPRDLHDRETVKMTKFFSAAAVLALLSIPAFAQDAMKPMDKAMAMKVTCKDMMAMDKKGMMSAAEGVSMGMMSDADAKAQTDKMATMTDAQKTDAMAKMTDSMTKMETACKGHDDMTVMDAMKAAK
jgi:hypothetical protein